MNEPTITITASRITYLGLSKAPLGGWDYTRTELGQFTLPQAGFKIGEAEREVRRKFPKATHIDGRETGTQSYWFAGVV